MSRKHLDAEGQQDGAGHGNDNAYQAYEYAISVGRVATRLGGTDFFEPLLCTETHD
jgi:hypothetical protein